MDGPRTTQKVLEQSEWERGVGGGLRDTSCEVQGRQRVIVLEDLEAAVTFLD